MEDTLNIPEERLKWVLKEEKLTAYALSKMLNYKSPDTIYHILKSKNKISAGFARRLEDSVLRINSLWLMFSYGTPFKPEIYYYKDQMLLPADLNYDLIKAIGIGIAKTFLGDTCKYTLEARVCGIKGLELKYTTFDVDKKAIDKIYSIILSVDWGVASFCEFTYNQKTGEFGQLLDCEENAYKIRVIIAEIMQRNKDEGSVILPFLGKDGAFKEICNS